MDDICKSCGKRIGRTQEMMTCRDGHRHHPVCLKWLHGRKMNGQSTNVTLKVTSGMGVSDE